MHWKWQQPDWPFFSYNPDALATMEAQFLYQAGVTSGILKHLSDDDKAQLTVEIIGDEALKTSEIEGEYLNRASLQSSIRRQFGLATDQLSIPPAEQGIAELMVDLYRSSSISLTHEQLFAWHAMVMKGHRGVREIGCYRTHDAPMQVVSYSSPGMQIHFEAPPSSQMAKEMDGFVDWFNRTAPDQNHLLPPLARAGIAHLYFVSIHPFEDGNGRIGRAVAEKTLAQALGEPTLIALAHEIEHTRKNYYDALERANKANEVTTWLCYFAATVLAAQTHTQKRLTLILEKMKLYDRLRNQLNPRQEKVIARLFQAGPEGFIGGLSAGNYQRIAKTSSATATRDLHDLVDKQALIRTGQRKSTRYHLNIQSIGNANETTP